MTAREAYQDVTDFCKKLETEWSKRDKDAQQRGVVRGIRIVKTGVEQKLDNLPEEEEENVQS
jgi:hypothetical protein